MCNIGDVESPILYNVTYPKARKEHYCCECASIINKGEKYQYINGLWETFQVFKTCLFCAKIRDQETFYDDMIPFEQLWECIGYDYI